MTLAKALNVAIIGAGPSGLYAAVELLTCCAHATVDIYDRLPALGGLVRYGVSPDHARRRAVTDVYERRAFATGRYRFCGNVDVGFDITHEQLLQHYHAVIYSSGAAGDRSLDIPGEKLPGSHAATDFVAWYNGHPDHVEDVYNFACERAVVIGNGNVALDAARMLLLGPEQLARTDIADHALRALASSRITEVVMLGRRGPAQAAFTLPELLELEQLPDIDVVVNAPAFLLDDAGLNATQSMRLAVLRRLAQRRLTANKRLELRFLRSPVAIRGAGSVASVITDSTRLVADDAGVRSEVTGEQEDITAGLVIRAIGYRARPLPSLPFDKDGNTIPHHDGRVSDPVTGRSLPAVYVAGWLKRGPRGVIGSNKACSRETVHSLLQDWHAGALVQPHYDPQTLTMQLKKGGARLVDVHGWRRIDLAERQQGAQQGRSRRKLCTREALLAAAGV